MRCMTPSEYWCEEVGSCFGFEELFIFIALRLSEECEAERNICIATMRVSIIWFNQVWAM